MKVRVGVKLSCNEVLKISAIRSVYECESLYAGVCRRCSSGLLPLTYIEREFEVELVFIRESEE